VEVAAPSPHATRPTGAGGAVDGRTLVVTTKPAERLFAARLYVITPDAAPDRVLQIATAAVRGGADVIQLRQKNLARGQLVDLARKVRQVTRSGALFIVNDDPDLARACDADGVHLGQDDGSVEEARALLGPDAILGLSTHSKEQIDATAELPVDYISVGPIWETPTKAGRPAVGLELVEHAAAHARHPFFAIGGIDAGNAEQVVRAGARRLCAVRAIRDAADPGAAAGELRRAFVATEGAERSTQDVLLDQPAPWRGVAPGG